MFTDIVGYTAIMQGDESKTLALRDRYAKELDLQHVEHGGRVVKNLGDGSLSIFPSDLAALNAAVAIQRALSAEAIPLRVGLHVGEVVIDDGDVVGDAVNIASRIESFGVPGAIMMSDVVGEMVRNRSDVHIVSMGRYRLKNVRRPIEIFAVSCDGVAERQRWTGTHNGEFLGLPPTGKTFSITELEIVRCENGRIVDLRNVLDIASLMAQLSD